MTHFDREKLTAIPILVRLVTLSFLHVGIENPKYKEEIDENQISGAFRSVRMLFDSIGEPS
jgi:hypothetical protein